MEPRPLATMVRTKLAAGELPAEKTTVLSAGYGRGHPCCVCHDPILRAQTQYEFDDPASRIPYRFHIGCFGLWDAELRRGCGRPNGSAEAAS